MRRFHRQDFLKGCVGFKPEERKERAGLGKENGVKKNEM